MRATRGPAWLFVPGDRPDRFGKAVATGADQVIYDLEDAVAPAAKKLAQEHVADRLAAGGSGWVRVNSAATAWHRDDLLALGGCAGLRGVVVPKVESAADLDLVVELLPVPVAALVESAVGVERLPEILAVDGLERLVLGTVDLAVDLGCDEDSNVVNQVRCQMVLASRAAGRSAPVDGVTTSLRDHTVTQADARRARREGFAGKLAIHPAQVPAIRAAFAPSQGELAWAREVLAAVDGSVHGAVAAAGGLVDAPVVERARRLLDDEGSAARAAAEED
jgi:citrate lyase subunit beta/citryl-CoA lyase